ncbi:AraC family transcriptional activator of pobA [Chryseobacterium sp. H1D6B]|uniref:helix-turn-helix domain-containing protein n=1 Tax=Chryseobacterium sp. H1D6B TaxID=2940588 RepID=UPI0015C9238F|nr:helix-turn-helix domain-containing protein [Chryseobacterium sp. H1D6B]MDH6252556.1 AraC family transcriptional activator of pobA [Chryseobacterium sp. H1D6B]
MKTGKPLNIKNFIEDYYPYDPSKKDDKIFFLSLDETKTFSVENILIHFYMVIIGIKGKCAIKTGPHEFLIKANSITIVPESAWLSIEKPNEAFEAKVLVFDKDVLKKGWTSSEVLNDLIFINPHYAPIFPLKRKQTADFVYKFNKISQEIDRKDPFGVEMIRLYLLQILYEYNRICEICLLNSDTTINRKFQLMHRFRQLVDEQFKTNKTVAAYADQMNITPKYLSECVMEHLGHSALKVIQNRILQEAAIFLSYTDKSIKEISNELNFGSPAHFSRFIHQHTGKNPTDLRK